MQSDRDCPNKEDSARIRRLVKCIESAAQNLKLRSMKRNLLEKSIKGFNISKHKACGLTLVLIMFVFSLGTLLLALEVF